MNYPNNTGFMASSETSQESAIAFDDSGLADSYDDIVMSHLLKSGFDGATADEIRRIINLRFPKAHNGTVNGRLSTLWRKDMIEKTKRTRTGESGRRMHVWVHNQYRNSDDVHAKPEKANSSEQLLKFANALWSYVHICDDGSVSLSADPLDMQILNNMAVAAGLTKKIFKKDN